VAGALDLVGAITVDARGDQSCGRAAGVVAAGTVDLRGPATEVWGADGDQTANGPGDVVAGQPAALASGLYSERDLETIRAFARRRGTYRRGAVSFNAANPLPSGVVFVDSQDGPAIGPATSGTDLASVTIETGAAPDGVFRGWLIVNGSIAITGSMNMRGLVYAAGDLSATPLGPTWVSGQLIAQHATGGGATALRASALGSLAITRSCADVATGAGEVPSGWFVKAGSYREAMAP
ncbi:MAG: hypothetical protein L0027_08265, partial [Candidatus Rokubacteria bacterium]|nr:hypothetical protein [Candidatus Rokubacteria bacterium]